MSTCSDLDLTIRFIQDLRYSSGIKNGSFRDKYRRFQIYDHLMISVIFIRACSLAPSLIPIWVNLPITRQISRLILWTRTILFLNHVVDWSDMLCQHDSNTESLDLSKIIFMVWLFIFVIWNIIIALDDSICIQYALFLYMNLL